MPWFFGGWMLALALWLPWATTIPFRVLDMGLPPLVEPGNPQPQVWVFRDERAWRRFWQERGQLPPPLDFSRQAVIGLTVGTRPTGGYSLQIDRIVRVTGRRRPYWVVHYTESVPGPDCLVTQAITTPTVWVVVEPPVPAVRFRGRTVTLSCR